MGADIETPSNKADFCLGPLGYWLLLVFQELPPPKADLLKSYHGDRANMRARRMMDQGKATDFSSAQAAAAKKEKDKSGFAPVASFKGPTILPPNKQE